MDESEVHRSSVSTRSLWFLLPAACAILGAVFWLKAISPSLRTGSRPYTAAHGALLATFGEDLPFEARLVASGGDFPASEPPRVASSLGFATDPIGARIQIEALIERQLAEAPSVETRAAAGVRSLLGSETEQAIAALEILRLKQPDDSRIATDLAAAYLVRAEEKGDPEDLVRALESAEEAAALDPRLAEAAFNRALALQALHLYQAAGEAWRRYLELDVTSTWAEAARDRLHSSSRESAESPAARPVQRPDGRAGDSALEVDLLQEGVILYETGTIPAARETLERALAALEGSGSEREPEARYFLALCLYQEADYDTALRLLDQVVAQAEQLGTTAGQGLAGRAHQAAGLIYGIRGEFSLALRAYLTAVDRYRSSGDLPRLAGVESALAELWELLGNREASWRHRYAAITGREHLDPAKRAGVLDEATLALLRQGYLAVAEHFADVFVEAAGQTDNGALKASALRRRATIESHLGDVREALQLLDGADAEASRIPSSTVARIVRADNLMVRGEILASSDPVTASATLVEASEILRETGAIQALPNIFAARARAAVFEGDSGKASRLFKGAVDRVVSALAEAPDADSRASLYATSARGVFDDAITFELDQRNSPLRALALTERARLAASARLAGVAAEESISLEDLRGRLAPDMTLVVYWQLRQRLVAWTIEHERVTFFDLGPITDALEDAIDVLRGRVATGESFDELSGIIYDAVLEPLESAQRLRRRLVIVPDGLLHGLSFVSLLDSKRGRYLLENHTVLISPRATAFARLTEDDLLPARPSVLVVAAPAGGAGVPAAGLLPAVRHEAQALETAFEDVSMLQGRGATRTSVLAALSGHDILHFGGHAVENLNAPAFSHLILGSQTQDPEESRLFARDLRSATFSRLGLVFLAGCSTSGSRGSAAPGLTGAFLDAGASVVVGSVWPVEDRATRELVSRFYNRIAAGQSPAVALHSTQVELLRSDDPKLANPMTWGAFQITGAWRPSSTIRRGANDAR